MPTTTLLLIVLAIILAAGLAGWQYYIGKRQSRWWSYAILRFITYFCLLLLLINPKINQQNYTLEKPDLILAVDNSRSIKEFEQAEQVSAFVDDLKNNAELKNKFNIQTYSFGEEFAIRDTFNFEENQTHISSVLSNLKKLYKSQTAPTILITDANQTIGRDYEFEAADYTQPVYPVVVGDTTRYEYIRIGRLNVNRYAFLNNKFPVEVFVNYEGNRAIQQKFSIKQGNHTLYSKTLSFDKENLSEIVQVELEAQKVGVHTYEAVIESLPNEKNITNNSQKFAVEIIDQQTHILLLSSFKHPDLGAFKKSIETNQQRKVDIHYTSENPEIDFGEYQLVILFQPDQSFKSALEQIENLDMNFLMVGGTKTDYRFLNRQQSYFHKEITNQSEEFLPVLNRNYPNFQIEDLGFDDYPPLMDLFGEIKMTGEHQVILYESIDGFERDVPLLATVEDGQRKFGFLFGENFWQWRAKSYRVFKTFEEFDEFTGKIIQYLASGKRKERLSLDFDSFYNLGESIIFTAHYFDETYNFDPRAKISAFIKEKENEQTKEFPFVLRNNRYELNLSSLNPGEYSFKIEVENKNLSKTGEFTIIDFDIEKQFQHANAEKLKKITENPLHFLNTKDDLIDELINNEDYKTIQKSKTISSPLIDWWYLLFIIALMLSIEWFIRKYRGMI